MLFRSQDKQSVFCFGAGCSLAVEVNHSDASQLPDYYVATRSGDTVYAHGGGTAIRLGRYASTESAILALEKMTNAIGTSGIMDAPTSEEIENERCFKPIPGPKWCEVPIAKKIDWRDMTIEEMDLSVRSYNCLHRTGLRTAGEVADFLAAGKTIRGFGRKSCKEVQWKLSMLQKGDK